MNILYIYGYPFFNLDSSDGPSVHINSTINAFRAIGCDVISCVGSNYKKSSQIPKNTELPKFFRVARKSISDFAELCYSLKQLLSILITKKKPDLIYERYSFFSWTGLALKNKWNIPFLIEFNDPNIELRNTYYGLSIFESLSNLIFHQIVSKADGIIAVSKPIAIQLISRGVSKDRVHVIPNGVSLDSFDSNDMKKKELIKNYKLQDSTVIGFLGGLAPWHGVNYLIEASVEIIDKAPESKFLIVGGDEISINKHLDVVKINNVSEHFIFTGRIKHDQIGTYIDVMDIVTAPYAPLRGNQIYFSPLKVFEYMAFGKPVVASRIEQLSEIFEDREEIILVEPGNKSELAAAILNLISNPDLGHKLGANAKEKVLNYYTWEISVQKILKIYEKVNSSNGN